MPKPARIALQTTGLVALYLVSYALGSRGVLGFVGAMLVAGICLVVWVKFRPTERAENERRDQG